MMKLNLRKRPFGVMIIIFINVASISLMVGTLVLIALNQSDVNEVFQLANFDGLDYIRYIFLPVQIILIAGIWYLKRWAWLLYMLRLGLSMLLNLNEHFKGSADVDYLFMIADVIAVFYMNQREVQRAFGYEVNPKMEREIIA